MDEAKVVYYQDRDDETTLLKNVEGGKDEGLYLWQIGPGEWKKLDGDAYELFSKHLFDPANNRILDEEGAKKAIQKLGKKSS